MSKRITACILMITILAFQIAGCQEADPSSSGSDVSDASATDTSAESSTDNTESEPELRWDLSMTPEEICAELTLEQKASQMVQGQLVSLDNNEMASDCYGSVFSTRSNVPATTYDRWINVVRGYQRSALQSDAGIPYIYGNDSVHGVNTAGNSILFPHNINIGAANDPELTYEYGKLVASDMLHTGMIWNFAPCIATSQDPRWGRTYESMSSDIGRTCELAEQFVRGQVDSGVVVCAKHFFGDGNVSWGTGEASGGINRMIDRGDATLTEEQIVAQFELYNRLIEAGAQTIMISHSAVNGLKMHENKGLIMRFREEYGFDGMIVSDYNSIHNCSGDTLYDNVVLAVNAGIDMLMEPDDFEECRDYIVEAVGNGDIPEERVNEAVVRIIRMKMDAGLFEDPMLELVTPEYDWYSDYGREVARTLAAESLVPIKAGEHLTIAEGTRVFVTGPAAVDTGVLAGGWTYTWLGESDTEDGTVFVPYAKTILKALQDAAEEKGFTVVTDPEQIDTCDMVLLCLGEIPYAEWEGDTQDLSIVGDMALSGNRDAIDFAMESDLPTTTLLVCGRNVIIDGFIDQWDSVIMCYLPGSEGGSAIADVLTGDAEFKGTLPMPYYSSVSQIGTGECWLDVGYSAVN